ncbi:MAG: alpha-hydroxy-acid oxidizing protein [Oscillospiraceae bacterium]|jgi:methylmalonyl-CoA mutase cobalamin-binding subunit|nr:alpha-hydroxy-acid oxidizing protein [Oscillospiraceae bacterium]
MTYPEVLAAAREAIGANCKACPVCNGRACGNHMPGPGAKGVGDNAIRNYEKWQDIRVNMDVIYESAEPDTSIELFGKTFRFPFFAGPVGAVTMHYGEKYNDASYNDILVRECAANGIAAFTGDGLNAAVMEGACAAIAKEGGLGVPTVKPWNKELIEQKFDMVRASGSFAVAMDIDASGLPFLKGMQPPAGSKSVEQLREIAAASPAPFILKGIMTVKSALKAVDAGVSGIVVSNHGGRVLDQCPATAEVLGEIADALRGSGVKIFVDGGLRTGTDIFKALALGADAVLVCRPFVPAIYGGAGEGVKLLVDKLGAELADTMAMCGVKSLSEIDRSCIRLPK